MMGLLLLHSELSLDGILHFWSRAKGGLSGEGKAERAMNGHSPETRDCPVLERGVWIRL